MSRCSVGLQPAADASRRDDCLEAVVCSLSHDRPLLLCSAAPAGSSKLPLARFRSRSSPLAVELECSRSGVAPPGASGPTLAIVPSRLHPLSPCDPPSLHSLAGNTNRTKEKND